MHGQAQIALSLWAQAAYHVGQMPVTTWTNPGPDQDADFTAVYNAWPVLVHAPTVKRDIRPLRAVVEVFRKMLIGQSEYPGKSNGQEMNAFIPEMVSNILCFVLSSISSVGCRRVTADRSGSAGYWPQSDWQNCLRHDLS